MRLNGLLYGLALTGLLATACTTPDTTDDDQRRGALGKADVYGSCTAESCGGKSDDGNCWCDDLCDSYGDCCANEAAVCDAPPPVPTTCGGFAGIQCPTTHVCVDDANDDCDPNNGGADCGGVCIPKVVCGGFGSIPCPAGDVCIDDLDDGCDPNNGGADCGGVCVPAPPTPPVPTTCGGFGNIQCPTSHVCVEDTTDDCDPNNGGADCGGVCIPKVFCGGFGNIQCASGDVCVDDPDDSCDPNNGGADCGGVCVPDIAPPPAANSCENSCGAKSQTGACYCDDLCVSYGDCCDDVQTWCN